jgi:hypothetical protein
MIHALDHLQAESILKLCLQVRFRHCNFALRFICKIWNRKTKKKFLSWSWIIWAEIILPKSHWTAKLDDKIVHVNAPLQKHSSLLFMQHWKNKKCLAFAKDFNPSLIFASKARAYRNGVIYTHTHAHTHTHIHTHTHTHTHTHAHTHVHTHAHTHTRTHAHTHTRTHAHTHTHTYTHANIYTCDLLINYH